MNKIEMIHSLVLELNHASMEYYMHDNSIMTDSEYDTKFDKLAALEKETGIILAGSPTQKVGGGLLKSLESVAHSSPMLSADKTKDIEKVISFAHGMEMISSWKEDGLTLVLRFKNGHFAQAITRGTGLIGEICSQQARMIRNLPLSIPYAGDLEVRAECLIPWDTYNELKESALEDGDEIKHPRNIASGAIRQLDTEKTRSKGLMIKAFAITACDREFTKKSECLDFLKEIGFDTVEYVVVNTADEIRKTVSEIFIPENYRFPVDGIIYEFNDIAYGKSLGMTNHHPLSIMALKWEDETYSTPFRGIDFHVTKTGLISMTAMFDKISIDHTDVSRALIPNLTYFYKFKFGISDFCQIFKANKIIPTIFDNDTKSGTYELPTVCPCCGEPLRKTDLFLFCDNEGCPAKHIRLFYTFCGKKGFDIDGLAESSLKKLLDGGYIRTFADIFALKQHRTELIEEKVFGEKTIDNILEAIEKSLATVTLDRLIASVSIPNIGRDVGKKLNKKFHGSVEEFTNAIDSKFDFSSLDGVGAVLSANIVDWFAHNRPEWDALTACVNIKPAAVKPVQGATEPLLLAGKTIVATGTLRHFTRTTIQEKIEALGGKPSSNVSKKTDYVLCGQDAGGKLTKAQELGVKVITEDEFLKMIGEDDNESEKGE